MNTCGRATSIEILLSVACVLCAYSLHDQERERNNGLVKNPLYTMWVILKYGFENQGLIVEDDDFFMWDSAKPAYSPL